MARLTARRGATMLPLEDRELLERWQAGDERAGNQLARRYFGLLARFFHNKVANSDDAVELVSETLLDDWASDIRKQVARLD
jgi:RNA polymerase sigma-70 factor (ECF subfamily)